jgi:hypothetical protein
VSDQSILVRIKRVLIGVVVGAAISIGTIVLLEGAASDYLFATDYRSASASKSLIRPHTAHDTLLGWVNRPSFSSPDEYGKGIALTTTALGFRGDGSPDTAVTARKGLVCSGDSYTLGYGVSDGHSWCGQLAHRVGGLRTYNMGQGDYGLDQTLLWYRRDGARASHQLQVVGVTNEQLERMTTESNRGRFKPALALDGNKLVTRNVPVAEQTTDALRKANASRVKDDLRLVQVIRRMPGMDSRAKDARRIDERWPLVERTLDEFAALDKRRGSQLVLAYLPTKRDIRPSYIDARRKRLADYSRQRGITFIDLTPPMRALRPDSIDLAFISRVPRGAAPGVANQYSNLGHAWVARMLAAHLGASTVADSR